MKKQQVLIQIYTDKELTKAEAKNAFYDLREQAKR